jgi:hypothetical protein
MPEQAITRINAPNIRLIRTLSILALWALVFDVLSVEGRRASLDLGV